LQLYQCISKRQFLLKNLCDDTAFLLIPGETPLIWLLPRCNFQQHQYQVEKPGDRETINTILRASMMPGSPVNVGSVIVPESVSSQERFEISQKTPSSFCD
jgi:hypothetical protein